MDEGIASQSETTSGSASSQDSVSDQVCISVVGPDRHGLV